MKTSPNAGANRRRPRIIDPKWQLSLLLGLLALAAAFSVVFFGIRAGFDDAGPDGMLSGDEMARWGLAVNAVYFVSLLAALLIYAFVLSHRVAGPAKVLRRALEGLREGDFDQRLTLRHRDYLKELAVSAELLRCALRDEHEARATLIGRLRAAVEAQDLEAVRAGLLELGELERDSDEGGRAAVSSKSAA